MKRNHLVPALTLLAALVSSFASSADLTTVTARDRSWMNSSVAAGAEQASLWGDELGDQGLLLRWPSRTKLKPATLDHDVHIVVMNGTFTVEWGDQYRELGPGGYASIPRGTSHVLGCEAAGECLLLVHRLRTK